MTCAAPAVAAPYVAPVSISAGSLPDALQTLERQTGIELLFDRAIVSGLHSPAVRAACTAEAPQAKRRKLASRHFEASTKGFTAWGNR
jgi:hypothetical protein